MSRVTISYKNSPVATIDGSAVTKTLTTSGKYCEDNIVVSKVAEKDVNLIDIDGTLLYSYTRAEAQALTALPTDGGTHTGFSFAGWNWSLANIKSYLSNHPDATIPVEAQYTSVNNETQFYITIPTNQNLQLPFNFSVGIGTINIDWGDGTTETASNSTSHTYSPSSYPASYVIKCTYSGNGTLYWAAGGEGIFGTSVPYRNMLTKAVIGSGSLSSYSFDGCRSLQTVIVCNGVSGTNNYTFRGCSSLQSISMPSSITSIGSNAFNGCGALQSIIFPDSITVIGGSAFSACAALQSITMPDAITTTGRSTFDSCSSLQTVSFSINAPSPSISMFANCSSLQSIYLPSSISTIGNNAFANCISLQSVYISNSIRGIGSNTFSGCESLILIDLTDYDASTYGKAWPTVTTSSFAGIPSVAKFAFIDSRTQQSFIDDTNWAVYEDKFIVKNW